MGDDEIYAVALMGLLVLGYGIFAMPAANAQFSPSGSQYAITSGGSGSFGLSGSGQPLAQGSVPPECGNVNDAKNVQHLSHHPDRFKACYPYVDPAFFKSAVGQDISQFTG